MPDRSPSGLKGAIHYVPTRWPLLLWYAVAAIFAATGIGALVMFWIRWASPHSAPTDTNNWRLLLFVILWGTILALGSMSIYRQVQRYLLVLCREGVTVRAERITWFDPDLHEISINWSDISSVMVIHVGGVLRPPMVTIESVSGTFALPVFVEDCEELIAEVVARADLAPVSSGWLRKRFARPSELE